MTRTVLVLALAGCGAEGRRSMTVPVTAGGAGAEPFAASDGGTVALSEASIAFSDLRLEEPAADEGATARVFRLLSPIQAAYAHPGHDYPGDVTGELLGAFTVDLLADDQDLGGALCYEGRYATGRVSLAGTAAILAGTHTGPGGDRAFRFVVPAEQDIIGIPFEVDLSADAPPTSIGLGFDPAKALQFVDWTGDDGDGDGVLTVADGTFANTATFGVVATPTWSLTETP